MTWFQCLVPVEPRIPLESLREERLFRRLAVAPQALPGSKMASAGADWQTNPVTQINWGLGYARVATAGRVRHSRIQTPSVGTDQLGWVREFNPSLFNPRLPSDAEPSESGPRPIEVHAICEALGVSPHRKPWVRNPFTTLEIVRRIVRDAGIGEEPGR